MIPTGGLYTIIHIIWIFIYKAFGIVRRNALSFLIILFVMFTATYGYIKTVGGALGSENSNIAAIKKITYKCAPPKQAYKDKKIIIRIDDIQAYWLRDMQIKMLNEVIKRNIPALLAIIPMDIMSDKKLVDYLKEHKCKFEFALHGWDQGKDSDYIIPEFGNLNEAEATERIMKGKPIVEEIAGQAITTFIPPSNDYSKGTKIALAKTGFKAISSEGKNIFDWTAESYDFEKSILVDPNEVIAKCKAGLEEKGVCVIMIHPQDFITRGKFDKIKYQNFLNILDGLEGLDAMFVTPRDMIYASELIPEIVRQAIFNQNNK